MSIHHLKINKQPFADLVSGRKTCEVRNCSDRDFKAGDSVELFMTETESGLATESIVRTITHIQRGYGLPDDLCVLSYAAPAVERQEPVAYRWRHHANPIYADRKVWEPITLALGAVYLERKARAAANNNRYPEDVYYSELELEPLHTSPPAPVAAVLPERMEDDHDPWNVGWNRCLDEIKELNQ